MNIKVVLFVLMISIFLILPCSATTEYYSGGVMDATTQIMEDTYNTYEYEEITSFGHSLPDNQIITTFRIKPIEHWSNVYLVKLSYPSAYLSADGSGGTFQIKNGATLVASGDIFAWSATPTIIAVQMEFDYWNRGTLTGLQQLSLTTSGITLRGLDKGTQPAIYMEFQGGTSTSMPTPLSVQIWSYDQYTTQIIRDGSKIDEENCLYINRFNLNRYNSATGRWTYSNLTMYDDVGTLYHTSASGATNVYNVSTISAPLHLKIDYGNPVVHTNIFTWTGSSTCFPPTTPTPTPTPAIPVSNSGCGMNIELSLSKYANIFPYENITASLSIDDTSNLTSGSKITYVIDTFNLNSPLVIATFTNISGTWHAYKNDLGIFSDYDTTLSDALSENIRFSDAGYYTVSAYVDTPTGCYVYDTVSANINPTSQVNVDFYFRDAVSGDLVGFVAATIANVGITGNVSYYGNPIGIAASRYDNISIYCDHEGYETKFFYYTVPQPPYGNVLDVPVYLTPLEAPIIYADNTVLSVNVKSAESGEPLSNADVSAYILGVECDSGWTDGNGFVSLIVPFHSGYTLLSTGRFPYNSDSRYLSLNNATSYSVDVYLSYAGTPIVTPTPSYNYTPTLTPTTTDTPMPTSTVISTPLLYVHVWDADGGMSYPISSAIVTIYDGDEVDQTYKGAIMYTAYTDTAGNIEPLQIESNSAFWCSISKTGYYTQIERYRMTTDKEAHIYVPLKRVGGNVTIATTQPTLVLPTPGGTGIQGGFIGWILDYFSEWFGVDAGTARILLALFIIMCSSVFVGGSLAGFGSGAGAGMGALIGGMFAFIAMCYVQFLPFWLLPIGIAFVGMAFFVWNRQDK